MNKKIISMVLALTIVGGVNIGAVSAKASTLIPTDMVKLCGHENDNPRVYDDGKINWYYNGNYDYFKVNVVDVDTNTVVGTEREITTDTRTSRTFTPGHTYKVWVGAVKGEKVTTIGITYLTVK